MRYLIFVTVLFCFLINTKAQSDINPNGYNKLYYPNESLQSEGILKDGKPSGYWRNYYPTGVKKSEGIWKNNELDSIWVFYNITGDTSSKITYLNGKKNGFSFEYYNLKNEYIIKEKKLYVNNKLEGNTLTYYESGAIKSKINYKNNLEEGVGLFYAKDDGRIVNIVRYRKGNISEREKINRYNKQNEKHGLWRDYYKGLRIKKEYYYKNGLLNGYYKEYSVEGELLKTVLYKEGNIVEAVDEQKIQSKIVEERYENGNIKNEGSFINSKPIGVHKEYSNDGLKIRARIYNENSVLISEGALDTSGYRTGKWSFFYPGGKTKAVGNYSDGRKEGTWEYFYKNGVKEQSGNFVKGRYDGMWYWFTRNGEVWKEEEFYKGKNEGLYTEYDDIGNTLVEGEYYDGEKEGEWTTIVNDHKAKGKYVSGLMDGVWKHYFNSGQLSFEGGYIQGMPDGKHKYYYPDGTLKEEQYYSDGLRQKHWKKYDEFGNLKITITYKNDKEYRINGVKINLPDENLPTLIK